MKFYPNFKLFYLMWHYKWKNVLQHPILIMNKISSVQKQDQTSSHQAIINLPTTDQKSHQIQSYKTPSSDNFERDIQLSMKKNTLSALTQATNSEVLEQNDDNNQNQQIFNQKPDLFQLDDQSIDPAPPAEMSIQVSDLSDQELFTPKINFNSTQAGSPAMDNFYLQCEPTRIFLQHPTQSKIKSDLSDRDMVQKYLVRRQKVMKYLKKRMNRSFKKRVSYHSRKTVAQSRLRVRGRFVTKCQAEEILDVDISRLCNKEIKVLLQRHYSG